MIILYFKNKLCISFWRYGAFCWRIYNACFVFRVPLEQSVEKCWKNRLTRLRWSIDWHPWFCVLVQSNDTLSAVCYLLNCLPTHLISQLSHAARLLPSRCSFYVGVCNLNYTSLGCLSWHRTHLFFPSLSRTLSQAYIQAVASLCSSNKSLASAASSADCSASRTLWSLGAMPLVPAFVYSHLFFLFVVSVQQISCSCIDFFSSLKYWTQINTIKEKFKFNGSIIYEIFDSGLIF